MNSTENQQKSLYQELKEFYDIHPGETYAYQNFEAAGLKEYKVIFNIITPLKKYEKSRLAIELLENICKYTKGEYKDKEVIYGYLTLNPIINYYEEFYEALDSLKEYNEDDLKKIEDFAYDAVINSNNSEEVKLAILILPYCSIRNAKSILNIFAIHNEYAFYVIQSYKKYKNFNEFLFNMAQISRAYGRMFFTMRLQPVNDEIKKWFIEEGAENEVGTHQLIGHSLLSFDITKFLKENKFDSEELENISRTISVFLSDYNIDEISNYSVFCNILINIIDKQGKGIYSLYAVVAVIYVMEAIIAGEYSDKEIIRDKKNIYDILEVCTDICKKDMWKDVISKEINNIETETSVLISCIEKTGYKVTIEEFEVMLKREPSNALMYKYAFGFGNDEIKNYVFDFAVNNFPKAELLSGQDNMHIGDVQYKDLYHVCYFIIIKYSKYENCKDIYKEINIEALKSPYIETRIQAVNNLGRFKGEFESFEREEIEDCIASELLADIRNRLRYLIDDSKNAVKVKKIDVKNINIEPHVKDTYLITVDIKDTYKFDPCAIYNKLMKEEMLYLIADNNNSEYENAIQVVTTEGYVIGYVPNEDSLILKNLLEHGKYLYAAVENFSSDYKDITISIYLSYRDVINEITTTLSLLSKEKEEFLQ